MSYTGFTNNTGLYVDLGAGNVIDPDTQGMAMVLWVHRLAAGWNQTADDYALVFCETAGTGGDRSAIILCSGVDDQVKVLQDGDSTDGAPLLDFGVSIADSHFDGYWFPVVFNYVAANDRWLYIESETGVQRTVTVTQTNPLRHVYIGTDVNGFSAMTQTGDHISDVAIFDRNLTTGEIAKLHVGATKSERGPQPSSIVSDGSCVHYWTLRGANSTVAKEDKIGSADLVAQSSGEGTFVSDAGENPIISGNVWINDAATKDGGEVLQDYPGTANWADGQIDMQTVIDTTGLSGQLYVGVESGVTGAIAWKAITTNADSTNESIIVPMGPIR